MSLSPPRHDKDNHIFPTSLILPLLTDETLLAAAWEIIQQHFRTTRRECCGGTILIVEVVGLPRGPIEGNFLRNVVIVDVVNIRVLGETKRGRK